MTEQFHLSVVATTRNDDHGKNLRARMQHFVDGFVEQCKRHQLKAELILVEWNPPADKPSLSQGLNFPADKGPCSIRIITVPKEEHAKLEHADNLPLFQMIGKNVGIRRALGKFVLATNIDILFSDELVKFMRDQLEPGVLYRVDRLDAPEELPYRASFDEILQYCADNILRINQKFGTKVISGFNNDLENRDSSLKEFLNKAKKIKEPGFIGKAIKFRLRKFFNVGLHTNACGDFTLLSYQDWEQLRGYPEWNMYSWHIDSVLLYQAYWNRIKEIDLPRNMPIYHIEHSMGSGYTPSGANLLFNRLKDKGIPFLSDSDLKNLIKKMKNSPRPVVYNNENWGMSNLVFEETLV